MIEVRYEKNRAERPARVGFSQRLARQPPEMKLDGIQKAVNFIGELASCFEVRAARLIESGHRFAKHGLDSLGLPQHLTRRRPLRQIRRGQQRFVEMQRRGGRALQRQRDPQSKVGGARCVACRMGQDDPQFAAERSNHAAFDQMRGPLKQ